MFRQSVGNRLRDGRKPATFAASFTQNRQIMSYKLSLITLLAAFPLLGLCQGYVRYDYMPSSSLKDKDGNKYGSGNLQGISGRYTVPLSRSMNERNQPTAWALMLSASYGMMENKGEAQSLNPDKILNTGLTVSHLRPLSKRWSLISSLGAGIYASPDDVSWQNLLASGAFIFAYRLSDNLSIGFGGGLTNSYGVPIIMPMGYLSWRAGRRYEVLVDIANAMKVQVAKQMGKAVKLKLTAMEMDGMAAVMHTDGRQKLYSSVMISSGLDASFLLFGRTSLHAGVGGMWLRSSTIADRNLKSFFKSLSDDDDGSKLRFTPTLHFSAGLQCDL